MQIQMDRIFFLIWYDMYNMNLKYLISVFMAQLLFIFFSIKIEIESKFNEQIRQNTEAVSHYLSIELLKYDNWLALLPWPCAISILYDYFVYWKKGVHKNGFIR